MTISTKSKESLMHNFFDRSVILRKTMKRYERPGPIGGQVDGFLVNYLNAGPYNINLHDFIPKEQNLNLSWRDYFECFCKAATIIIVLMCLGGILQIILLNHDTTNSEYFSNEIAVPIRRPSIISNNTSSRQAFQTRFKTIIQRNRHLQQAIRSFRDEKKYIKTQPSTLQIELPKQNYEATDKALPMYGIAKIKAKDFALESSGGYMIPAPDTRPYHSGVSYDFMGIYSWQEASDPRHVIQSESLPGQCFAFRGQKGIIRIGLSTSVNITAITIEHLPSSLFDKVDSALKEFIFYGMYDKMGQRKQELGCFVYKVDKKSVKTFKIIDHGHHPNNFSYVELQVLSNHGNQNYTCVYRIQVHGSSVKTVF